MIEAINKRIKYGFLFPADLRQQFVCPQLVVYENIGKVYFCLVYYVGYQNYNSLQIANSPKFNEILKSNFNMLISYNFKIT